MTTIRAITLAVGDPHPLTAETFGRAANILRDLRVRAEDAGHTVQTTRVATRPLLADLADRDGAEVTRTAADAQHACEDNGLEYLSLGPAPVWDPAFPLARLQTLAEALAGRPTLSASAQVVNGETRPRYEGALAVARAMFTLAAATAGDGNFRFALLAMCPPGGPFFPQAYAEGPEWSVSFGLQSANTVGDAIARAVEPGPGEVEDDAPEPAVALEHLERIETNVREALAAAASPVAELLREGAEAAGIGYGGVDLSPAPMADESIAAAFEQARMGLFGAPGTLALAATLTAAIKAAAAQVGEAVGYNGLMLPVLEDETLGVRCAEGTVSVTSLLAYSAVCGTGLDTVPLAGDAPMEAVAALLADVAALAWRLRKPLSARLFLTPGARAGDMTNFASPYLTNTRVLPL